MSNENAALQMLDGAYFNGMAADGSWCALSIEKRSQSATKI